MKNILLTFLLILLACSIAESFLDGKTKQTVYGICKQTEDTKFCSSVFLNNLVTSSPSYKELMNVTLTVAERFSANTNFFVSTLLRNAGNEREDLQMCAEAYTIVNIVLEDALDDFLQRMNSNISSVENKVYAAIEICKTDFDTPGFKINPLIEKNRKTRILMAILNIVHHMFSS